MRQCLPPTFPYHLSVRRTRGGKEWIESKILWQGPQSRHRSSQGVFGFPSKTTVLDPAQPDVPIASNSIHATKPRPPRAEPLGQARPASKPATCAEGNSARAATARRQPYRLARRRGPAARAGLACDRVRVKSLAAVTINVHLIIPRPPIVPWLLVQLSCGPRIAFNAASICRQDSAWSCSPFFSKARAL